MKSARMLVAKALVKMQCSDSYSNLLLDHSLSQSGLTAQDKAFASALFYGVLERMITLDAMITTHIKVPLSQLDVEVHVLLQCGLYQILYMDSVPESAAVNESVKLAKAMGKGKAAGFVNGVLRQVLREGKIIPLPDPQQDKVGFLSLKYSCPRWLVGLWLQSYGEERCEGILQSSLGRPPLFARINTLKTTRERLISQLLEEGVKASGLENIPGALLLEGIGEIRNLASFQQGLFHIQDLSSQLCALALNARPGERVMDLCAAPGGKTFTIAQMMEDKGEILSFDLHPHKVRLIEEGARRLGLSSIRPTVGDAASYNETLPLADRVLCDLPCSGLGIIRRKPEIKYKSRQECERMPEIQYKILKNAADYVKVGGTLLFSTCALHPKENEENANRFLREHENFSPKPLPELFSQLFSHRTFSHQLTIFPEDLNSDGFFLSTFTRMW